jgi:hypothetical protein
MAKLAIYMNEAGNSVLHRTGFSWVAAMFPPLWALQHRLYKTCVATLVIYILLILMIGPVPKDLSPAGPWIAWIPWFLIQVLGVGFGANPYHRLLLERSGYFMTSAEPRRLKSG